MFYQYDVWLVTGLSVFVCLPVCLSVCYDLVGPIVS